MKRISILVLIFCACFVSVAWGQKPACPASVNWTEFHTKDMMRWNPCEKVLKVNNVGNLQKLWSYTTGNYVSSSPAVANGVVYVGSEDGNVYALDPKTGALLWSYTTDDTVASSPAVADGVVYVGSGYCEVVNNEFVACDGGSVYALKAKTGALLWKFQPFGYYYYAVLSSPAVANGVVYVGWAYESKTQSQGGFLALNAKTGAKVWSYTTGYWVVSSPAVANGVVYVDGLALNAKTGTLLWTYPGGYGSPAVANGVVYVGCNDSVCALNASTGALLWSYATGNCGCSLLSSSPAVVDGVVYVGGENNVYALNASTGALLWSYPTGSSIDSSPAVANGVVYVGSWDNNVYALNASTGALLWSYTTDYEVESSPAVANGVVYVGSDDGNLYAFGLP